MKKTYGNIKRNRIGQFIGNSNRYRKQMQLQFMAIMIILVSIAPAREIYLLTKEVEHSVDVVHAAEVGKPDPIIYAVQEAKKHGLNPVNLLRIIDCESAFNPEAIGINPKDKSADIGFVQINHKWHKEVSIQDKLDPYKSVDWMIKTRLQDGNYHQWSCANKLGITK